MYCLNLSKSYFYIFAFLFAFIFGCGVEGSFKQTQTGKAIYSCVAGSGQLNVKSIGDNKVEAHLVKGKNDVRMQFAIDSNIGQAKLIGAEVAGKSNLSKLSLMITLELMCGGELASQLLSDEYNTLRLMNRLR